MLYKIILQNRCSEIFWTEPSEPPPLSPSHPLNHAITTKFYLSSRHHAINMVRFTITPINLDLHLDFYGGA